MKILYITAAFQHPKIRGSLRHYHLVRELARNNDVTLLTLVRSSVEPEAFQEMHDSIAGFWPININGESTSKFAAMAGKVPFVGGLAAKNLKQWDGVREMKKRFTELVAKENFDLVVFHGKSIFSIIEGWNELPIVTDFCDATSLRMRTSMRYNGLAKVPYYFVKWLNIRRLEMKMVNQTPHVAFISNRDREAVLGPEDRSAILPLGVDHDFWKRRTEEYDRNCVAFTGVMDYAPNHDAAIYLLDRILPRLKKAVPDVKLLIIGREPKPELMRRAAALPEVEVTGFVDDVRPYLERAAVFAAPIRFASGSQNKVLEAMAMNVPVVTTPIVSDGIEIDEYGTPPLISASKDGDFVDAVVGLLQDQNKHDAQADRGLQFVRKYFNWTASAERLEQMCREAMMATQATR